MNDLIRRKDVLNLVSEGISTDTYEDMEYTIELIKAIPTAEPKKGIWIEHPMHIECDQCKVWFLKKYLLRNSYCPNCGAKMERRE